MNLLSATSVILSCIAAVLGIRAATVQVRDNMDAFISDLQRQGRWASYAAMTAALATAPQAFQQFQ